ncbi:MAG: EF-P lysine aminoacylase EpmA [Deltaproteobacteria bacterium]|nr:EF-P lysine aminoacylase EpmA [Deltaproteobacteria bacterium]
MTKYTFLTYKNQRYMSESLRLRRYVLSKIREFFERRRYIETETPYIVRAVPPDPYIEPIHVYMDDEGPFFLHTSPEIHMKKILAKGFNRIFQICRTFRREKKDELHTVEFTMLEWYREGNYMDTLKETEELVEFLVSSLEKDFSIKRAFFPPFPIFDLESLFSDVMGVDIFSLDRDTLYQILKNKGVASVRTDDSWIDMFFKAFFEKIDTSLEKKTPYFLIGWPLDLSSMAKGKNQKAERFELYIEGVEIANGYSELLDPEEQRKRFEKDNAQRKKMGKKEIPIDEDFILCLSRIKGEYSGVALGVDRLIMVLAGEKNIENVMPFIV